MMAYVLKLVMVVAEWSACWWGEPVDLAMSPIETLIFQANQVADYPLAAQILNQP